MSHLDTAYQLGVKKAEQDFNAELQKAAQGVPPVAAGPAQPSPKPVTPAPMRAPGGAVPPPAPPGAVNPDWKAGLKNRGY